MGIKKENVPGMKINLLFIILTASLGFTTVKAQITTRQQVAIFVPLYLDSAFDISSSYRYGKNFPKQSINGLEFFEGAQFAMDSIHLEGIDAEYHVFDTRNASNPISRIVSSNLFDSINLIIGSVSGNEYLLLADLAKRKKIPFISATYPNDGGIKSNPQVVMVNPKINTHLQATYNHLLKNYAGNKLIYLRRNNFADDRVFDVFKSLDSSASGGLLKFKPVNLPEAFSINDIQPLLDSMRQNVIICGSLDENFGRDLALATSNLGKPYQVTLIGMPTWESIKELSKPELKAIPIIYSSSFYNPGTEKWTIDFETAYRKQSFSKPSDMAYRGFEITYYFMHLLQKYGTTLNQNLTDKSIKLITDYDFRPIRWTRDATTPDYYENKRVYLLKHLNGMTTPLY